VRDLTGMKQCFAVSVMALAVGLVTSLGDDSQKAVEKRKKATSGELFEIIARMDSQVFDAFNAHDLERLMALFTDDLEFYDDGSGVKNFSGTKQDFVKVFHDVPDLHRELLKETLEVYPVPGYGAIEVGEHRFCHQENGKADCGVMKFAMVWKQTGETWKLARVLSYAH
jgi:ketosteroid isomerase-like protein